MLAIKCPTPRKTKFIQIICRRCSGYARGGMLKLRFDWYIKSSRSSFHVKFETENTLAKLSIYGRDFVRQMQFFKYCFRVLLEDRRTSTEFSYQSYAAYAACYTCYVIERMIWSAFHSTKYSIRFEIPGLPCDEWNSIFRFLGLNPSQLNGHQVSSLARRYKIH